MNENNKNNPTGTSDIYNLRETVASRCTNGPQHPVTQKIITMNDLFSENVDSESAEVDAGLVRKCRLTRNNSVQYSKICAREERNASIKKVVCVSVVLF